MLSLDIPTRKRLMLAKALYQRALVASAASHSDVENVMSVVTFDLANETAIKAAYSSIEVNRTPPDSFHALIQAVDSSLSKSSLAEVPDKTNLYHVHTIRNDAQHKAAYPSPTTVSDCRTYTRDFLSHLVANVWGETFDSLTMADLIQNDYARGLLQEAERLLTANDFRSAIKYAGGAMVHANRVIAESLVGPSRTRAPRILVGDRPVDATIDKTLDEAFAVVQNTVLILAMGLDLVEYSRFNQLTGLVYSNSFTETMERNSQGLARVKVVSEELMQAGEEANPSKSMLGNLAGAV